MFKSPILLILLALGCFFASCNKPPTLGSEFTLQDEIALGERLNTLIQEENNSFLVVDKNAYPAVKAFLNESENRLTSQGLLQYGVDFDWEINVLDGPQKNVFVLPGGHVYIYSGLIKENIKTGAACLGVLAHEVALADKSFSTQKLKDKYSLSLLLDVSLGNNEAAAMDLVNDIISIPYTEEAIRLADRTAVNLLCPSDARVADYSDFVYSESTNSSSTWLDTHPFYSSRTSLLESLSSDCTGENSFEVIFTEFANQLQ